MLEPKQRIDKANGVCKGYIKRAANGEVDEIKCMKCGTPVQSWVDDDVVDTQTVGGKRVDTIRQKFRRLNNYRQVGYVLSNNTKCEPIVCAGCAPKMTLSDGEALWCCHLHQLSLDKKDKLLESHGKLEIVKYLGVK